MTSSYAPSTNTSLDEPPLLGETQAAVHRQRPRSFEASTSSASLRRFSRPNATAIICAVADFPMPRPCASGAIHMPNIAVPIDPVDLAQRGRARRGVVVAHDATMYVTSAGGDP